MYFPAFLTLLLYVLMIVVCTAAMTLYVGKAFLREGTLFQAVVAMTAGFLLYTVFEMIVFLFPYLSPNTDYYALPMLGSDLAYLLVVVPWIIILIDLADSPRIRSEKKVLVGVAVYACIVEPIGVLKWVAPHDVLNPDVLSWVALFVNLLFDFVVFEISVYFLRYGMRTVKDRDLRRLLVAASGALAAYMLYVAAWNFFVYRGNRYTPAHYMGFDPVLFLYAAACIVVIVSAVKGSNRRGDFVLQRLGVSEDAGARLRQMADHYGLTNRERELVELVVGGKSNPEIADQLGISENTVKHHLNAVFRKTEVKTRYALIQKMGHVAGVLEK